VAHEIIPDGLTDQAASMCVLGKVPRMEFDILEVRYRLDADHVPPEVLVGRDDIVIRPGWHRARLRGRR
jgi:hypothetical protein